MKASTFVVLVLALVAYWPATSMAGPYADDLGKCLVESTSQRDRVELVRWMFVSMSRHPAVKPIATISDGQLEAASKEVAALFTSLLTDSCRQEAEKALQFEGLSTFEVAFSVLGNVAGREIFTNPEVAEGLALLDKYVDEEELSGIFGTD